MKKSKYKFGKKAAIAVFILLILITLATPYHGSTDIGDYADVAKYFTGKYGADIRSSHSYLYGFMHAPFVWLFGSFIGFKLTSLLVLALIIYSVYLINGRYTRTMWLMLLSPIVWYMAPWINPIQLAGLFMLWAWFFVRRFNNGEGLKNLLISGVFVGLGWAVWDTILFFGFFLGIVFLFDKRLWHGVLFLVGVGVGLIPRLMLDRVLFGFPFYSIMKSGMGTVANVFGGIYSGGYAHSSGLMALVLVFLAIPVYYWMLYTKGMRKKYARELVFLTLCLLMIVFNPQVRYVIALAPIMVVLISREISKIGYRRYIVISIVLIGIFVYPYIGQIGTSGENLDKDVLKIIENYPNETFIVGPAVDDYSTLARYYWGDTVNKFVSVQDYNAWKSGNYVLFEKEFKPVPNIDDRRQIWIKGGMDVNENIVEDYAEIKYGIGVNRELKLDGFELVEDYGKLSLWRKA